MVTTRIVDKIPSNKVDDNSKVAPGQCNVLNVKAINKKITVNPTITLLIISKIFIANLVIL